MSYLLDANVFIQAKNLHYGLDFCPAFWQWLIDSNASGHVLSIDKVADEINAGADELTDWVKQQASALFRPTDAAVAAKNTRNVVLEKSYEEYMVRFRVVLEELVQRFPDPTDIEKESDKKAFVKLFGEYLRAENVLQNYDEFASLKALQELDSSDPQAVEAFKERHNLDEAGLAKLQDELQTTQLPTERTAQDYRSTYNDIRDWLRQEKNAGGDNPPDDTWDDVVFEVELLKSQEINLDYILELIFEKNKHSKDKTALVEDLRGVIRASLGNRAKESLLVDFIQQTDLDTLDDKADLMEAFFRFAQAAQQSEMQALIEAENLDPEAARRYLSASLNREYASENGMELNALLPKMSPLNPQYLTRKQSVFQKIAAFVEKFKGVGGQV